MDSLIMSHGVTGRTMVGVGGRMTNNNMNNMNNSSSSSGGGGGSSIMSISIGGRIVTPHLPVVDASGPNTEVEFGFDELLEEYSKEHIPLESTEGIQRRERVLDRMRQLCRIWIQYVCLSKSLPKDMVENAGGQLFTSGSYRLGVHEPGADIDVILVAPNICTRSDFFGSIHNTDTNNNNNSSSSSSSSWRDPNSLAERIRVHPDVTNFVAVEDAKVPILTFDWEGVNIDLLFATLNSASVPANLDIDNDAVLDGVDAATEKSLNGPRVTNLIAALVSGTPERYQVFLKVVRCVRKWAKARGLYSNKMGYWGGVNINIAVALVLQLYPNTCAASLLRKFFLVFKSWRWPNPVMLTKPHDAHLGLSVWNAYHVNNMRQVAPIITPAYPAMNSTLNVSRQTLQILHEEFCRAHTIIDQLWKTQQKSTTKLQSTQFGELFQPSDFFISYPYYMSLCIVAPTEAQEQKWAGFVESRLRKLVSDLLGKSLPLSKIQLWPKKLERCVADRTALLTHQQRSNSITYFIGFIVDELRMRGNQLNLEQQIQNFSSWELSRYNNLEPGMDVMTKQFTCKTLPKIVFEDMMMGGKLAAMKKRKQLRNADPKVKEQKRLQHLNRLKLKMERLQQKKQEAAAAAAAAAAKTTKPEDEPSQTTNTNNRKQDDNTDNNDNDETATKTKDGMELTNDKKRKRGDNNDNNDHNNDQTSTNEDVVGDDTTTRHDDVNLKSDDNNNVGLVAVKKEVVEEELMLESALDMIQSGDDNAFTKTREEAERDRELLLKGELLTSSTTNAVTSQDDYNQPPEDYNYDDDDDDVNYGIAAARPMNNNKNDNDDEENKQASIQAKKEEDGLNMTEVLKQAGYTTTVVSEEEDDNDNSIVVGANVIHPWRHQKQSNKKGSTKYEIQFDTVFDIVELDDNGFVVDKGCEDFMPSAGWIGRKPGFEFKLGERGLGYYRTGKKVVVPSNTTY